MAKLVKKRSKKAGLLPGTPVHIGDKKVESVKVTLVDYDENNFEEKEIQNIEECASFKEKPTVTWLNVDGIHNVEILQKLGDCFGFHPLILEDIMNTDQRPKMENFGDYIYIVLRILEYNDKTNEIISDQVSLILGSNFIISFQEKESEISNLIKERIKNGKGRIRKMGADYLAYSLMDSIVDNYFVILEKIGEKIEFLEEELIKNATPSTLKMIHGLKREMIILRKSVWPLREVISNLGREESPLIQKTSIIYIRDVYDHTVQIIDTVETLRDMISGMIDIYLSSVSNRMNEVMKVLTIIATIFIPLTFIAGVYGMNFKYMPELEWRYGYAMVWVVVVVVSVSMMVYFRKKKWL